MRAYVECSPNQSKNYTLSTFFHWAIDKTLKILEMCWLSLYLNFTRVLQFSSTSPRLQVGYHHCKCTNRQLFPWYVNRYPSVCVAKVISWHAFVNHQGMFSKIKWCLFNDYWCQSWIISSRSTRYELVWCQDSFSLWTRKIISWFSFVVWLPS